MLTPEHLAAYYGGQWDQRDYVKLEVARMRYCRKCEVAQAATENVACWICGKPMSADIPKGWPPFTGEFTERFDPDEPERTHDLF